MEKNHIYFFVEDINYHLKDKNLIRQWINSSIQNENKSTGNLNIIFCSDDYLLKMNQEFLEHDTFTDIITFDYSENEIISGDIFISLERVMENAKKYSMKIKEELHRVIIHGILHLCGLKDKLSADKKIMTQKENYYLSRRPDKLTG